MKKRYSNDSVIRAALASGKYEVDPQGVIWNLDYRGRGERREVIPYLTSAGYLRFRVTLDDTRSDVFAHRFIAFALLGEPPAAEFEVNHRDGNKANNQPENIEWLSREANVKHAWETGLKVLAGPVGMARERHPGAKLTEGDVAEIRKRLQAGETQGAIAAAFGIKQPTVSRIKHGNLWPEGGPNESEPA